MMDRYLDYMDGKLIERMKFDQAWEKFIERQESRNGIEAPSTLQIKQLGRLYIVPELTGRQLARMTVDDFQDVINCARPVRKNASD